MERRKEEGRRNGASGRSTPATGPWNRRSVVVVAFRSISLGDGTMQPCNAATGTGNPGGGMSDANSACVPEAEAGLVKASLRISLSYLTTFPSCFGFSSGFPAWPSVSPSLSGFRSCSLVLPSGPGSLSRVRSRLLCLAFCPAFPASALVLPWAAAPPLPPLWPFSWPRVRGGPPCRVGCSGGFRIPSRASVVWFGPGIRCPGCRGLGFACIAGYASAGSAFPL